MSAAPRVAGPIFSSHRITSRREEPMDERLDSKENSATLTMAEARKDSAS
jgi:hypothetical protein